MKDLFYLTRAQIIKAMAHPSRLKMVTALADKELCVRELKAIVKADMSTVSKHLAIMKNAGIVQDRKKGLQVYYRLTCPCTATFLACIESFVKNQRSRFSKTSSLSRKLKPAKD
ncbi:MAG: winged helix-turn-helix transcriptional regulator [Deltaproteobacteria bacterium]|nr:winged helix-turn-helix transcriptional regulator [Deltaproteobacteria bacterium]